MVGIQGLLASDLFQLLEAEAVADLEVAVSFFEIYGGRCQDLLNNRNRLSVREDGSGEVVIGDLEELPATSVAEMLEIIELGNRNRTTHATESNDESSR
jgi:kinesin family protein 2/24